MSEKTLKFIDLFAGIGGFHIAFNRLGADCVFASEIDAKARKTYIENIKKIDPDFFEKQTFNDDILSIKDPSEEIPDFDILCAGFPCQPFSQAGFKKGFSESLDSRGEMFFKIANILYNKRPLAYFLENVRYLINHDDGKTFNTIRKILENELGYTFFYKIVKASEFNLPQNRPRVYIVGFNKEYKKELPDFEFPKPVPLKRSMSDIWGGNCNKEVGYTLRVGGRGSRIDDRRNWDAYLVDGIQKRLGPNEGKKMMGFPDDFEFPVSETEAMKQLGNSVAINAIQATAEEIFKYIKANKLNSKMSHDNGRN